VKRSFVLCFIPFFTKSRTSYGMLTSEVDGFS